MMSDFELLGSDCVISTEEELLSGRKTLMASEASESTTDMLNDSFSRETQSVFTDGYPCKVLQPMKGWRTGRLKLRVYCEFYPDEAPSSDS